MTWSASWSDVESFSIRVHREKRVTGMREIPEGFAVIFESGEEVAAQYVVATDGAQSVIRSIAGIDYLDPFTRKPPAVTPSSVQLVLADVTLVEPYPASVSLEHPVAIAGMHGVTLIIPLRNSRFRLVLTDSSSAAPHAPSQDYLQATLAARWPGPPPTLSAVQTSSRYRTRNALASAYWKRVGGGYVLLAGDAAHIHSPFGGQGMNLALCDGAVLAKAIVSHSQSGDDNLFAAYERKRTACARVVIDTAERITSLARWHGAWAIMLRNFIMRLLGWIPGFRKAVARRVSGIAFRD